MRLAARTRELALVSFVALSVGFAAGWWLARNDAGGGAPHAVGPDEHRELGTRALESGDIASAERHFREALALGPDALGLHADLAAVLMLQGRWDEAHAELETARQRSPDDPEVWFLLGMVWREGYADTVRARGAWARFLGLVPPGSPEAATVRAWLAELEGEPGESPRER